MADFECFNCLCRVGEEGKNFFEILFWLKYNKLYSFDAKISYFIETS